MVGGVLVLVTLLTLGSVNHLRGVLEAKLQQELERHAAELRHSFLNYVENERSDLKVFIDRLALDDILLQYPINRFNLQEGSDRSTPRLPSPDQYFDDLQQDIDLALLQQELDQKFSNVLRYTGWYLIGALETIVASNDPDTIGFHRSIMGVDGVIIGGGFNRTQTTEIRSDSPAEGEFVMEQQIIDDIGGTVLGTLVVTQSTDRLSAVIPGYGFDFPINGWFGAFGHDQFRFLPITQDADFQTILPLNQVYLVSIGTESAYVDTFRDSNGERVVTYFEPVFGERVSTVNDESSRYFEQANWGVFVQFNSADALPSWWSILSDKFLYTTMVTLVLIALGAFLVNVWFTPLTRLIQHTRLTIRGQPAPEINQQQHDEIGALRDIFNQLVESAHRSEQSLEEAVQRRTAELAESRDQLSTLVARFEQRSSLMEQDLRQAEVIQRSLLPQYPPRVPGFSFSAYYLPSKNVGGDMYDVFRIDDRYIGLVVADATGHGVSAAMLSVLFKNRLDLLETDDRIFQYSEELPSTQDNSKTHSYSAIPVFQQINNELVSDIVGSHMYVSAAFAVLDTKTKELSIANAGHPPVVLLRATGAIETVKSPGPALGLVADAHYEERTVTLAANDLVLMYTDGVLDLDKAQRLSVDGLVEKLREHIGSTQPLQDFVHGFNRDHSQDDADDVTLLMIEFCEGRNRFDNQFDSVYSHDEVVDQELTENQNSARIEFASTETSIFLVFFGRVTWIQGEPVTVSLYEALQERKVIIVDLSSCEYLDSAMLGTLHETAQEYSTRGLTLIVQGVTKNIYDEFVELGMIDVVGFVVTDKQPLPAERTTLVSSNHDLHATQQWLLRAHEVLASLNDANQEEFKNVIQELRAGIESAENARGNETTN